MNLFRQFASPQRRLIALVALTSLATILFTGCATKGRWRQGWVVRTIAGTTLRDAAEHTCVSRLSIDEIAKSYLVEITYPRGRFLSYRTVLLPDGLSLEPHEKVWIDIHACYAALRKYNNPPPSP